MGVAVPTSVLITCLSSRTSHKNDTKKFNKSQVNNLILGITIYRNRNKKYLVKQKIIPNIVIYIKNYLLNYNILFKLSQEKNAPT
jgi:hypothetical protein